MSIRHGDGLDHLRLEAKFRLKDLRSEDPARERKGAEFFARLKQFDGITDLDEVLAGKRSARLKEALNLIAEDQGYASWHDLVTALPPREDEQR